MKRIILSLGAAVVLAVPAGATAADSPAQCSAHGLNWDTPGKMFQAARGDLGVNPQQLAGVHGATVGQLIQAGCRG